jgi:hypothetical protein
VVSTSDNASKKDGRVSWLTDVAAGATSTFTVTAVVGKLPPTTLRLASVACARAAGTAKPMVCATDTDLLPAGLAQSQAERQRVAKTGHWWGAWWSLAAAVPLVGLGLVAFPAPRRWLSRHRRPAAR